MSPATLAIIAQFAIQYGIPAAQSLIALFKQPTFTVADVETLFAGIKTYDQYNVPPLAPQTVPAPAEVPAKP